MPFRWSICAGVNPPAVRLVLEAKARQVVVFTHDLLFLHILLSESASESVDIQHQYIRREGYAGVSSPDLPWVATNVKKWIGILRNRLQSAKATLKNSGVDAYESAGREIYGLLREVWERAISEVLLNDVVDRYRPSIKTQQVAPLHDITEADCKAVEQGMTEASKWIRGHDKALADATPFPQPLELEKRIEELETWVKSVRDRRR